MHSAGWVVINWAILPALALMLVPLVWQASRAKVAPDLVVLGEEPHLVHMNMSTYVECMLPRVRSKCLTSMNIQARTWGCASPPIEP